MFSIKIAFNGEIRRVAIPVVGGVPSIGINELNDLTKRAFPSSCPQAEHSELLYSWTDEDGDVITVSSDDELRLAIACLHAQEISAFKFQVVSKPLPRPASATPASANNNADAHTTHAHVTCDECGMSPIVGPRFKCSVRSDFDLCQGCEAAGLQPYPMIKVYHPDQNPLAIIVAVDDDRPRFGGPHGHGNHRFGRHGHGHPHGPRPHGGPHGHRGGPNRPWCHKGDPSAETQNQPNQQSAPWRGRCGAKSAFINAFDAFAAGLVGAGVIPGEPNAASEKASSTPAAATAAASTAAGNNDDTAATEQALLEQAVQASIEEQIAKQPTPAPSTTATAAVPAAAVEPKPAMRFVRDATFPDGTKVQPGSVFVKTWRVRNDGSAAWPDNTALVTAGGDLLTAPDLAVPASMVNPGDEVDLSATLTAPASTGRHTAYFRLQNRDTGAFFGQRLWADVRVEDADPSWFVLEAGDSAFGIAPEAAVDAAASQQTTADAVIADVKPQAEPQQQSAVMPEVQVLVPPEPAVPTAAATAAADPSEPASASGSADSVALDVWSRVWSSELEVLKQMGFTNIGALVPVLQEHIQVPAMLSETKRVNADALQAIVIQLLGMSM